MNSTIKELLPYLIAVIGAFFTLLTGLITWFYNLNERRMNARVNEIEGLHLVIDNMKDEREKDRINVGQMGERIRGIEKNQKEGFDNLNKLIADKMDSIKELFTEKLKNK